MAILWRLVLSALLSVPTACAEPPLSPMNLDWLRRECGDGALAHHAAGRIYLTELSTGQTVFVAHGNQPEFSPDSSKLAWIDGRTAKGRERRGSTIHRLASGVDPSGGVHWFNDQEVLVILKRPAGRGWYRVSLTGEEIEVPELTRLGRGGYECDVRLAEDGVWSYVAKRPWRTSDGGHGVLPGTCSVSLSIDGRSATSLHNPHKECPITAIRPGGYEGTLWWQYRGGFDNHRFASNDPRFIVCVDEHTETMVVTTLDGQYATRMGTLGRHDSGMYGDFTVGDSTGKAWPQSTTRQFASEPTSWPGDSQGLVFKWESGTDSNTISDLDDGLRLCRLIPKAGAKPGRFFAADLAEGWCVLEEKVENAIVAALRKSGEFSLEAVVTPEVTTKNGTLLTIHDRDASYFTIRQKGESLSARLRTRYKGHDLESPEFSLGTMTPGEPQHVLIAYTTGDLRGYRNGEEVSRTSEVRGNLRSWTEVTFCWGAGPGGRDDWRGRVEGIACYDRFLGPVETKRHYDAYRPRLRERSPIPRLTVSAILERTQKVPDASVYPQVLVVYSYRVIAVKRGDYRLKELLVAHWGVLNGQVPGVIRDRRVGREYLLHLEPFEDHPELRSLKLVMGREESLAPLFYAVNAEDSSEGESCAREIR